MDLRKLATWPQAGCVDAQPAAWICPAQWTVERGRDAYLAQNGFTLAGYDEPVVTVNYAGLRLRVPNPPKRRWAVRLHDLHHVATGFGTDPIGEAEISAWELRGGLRALGPYVGSIVLWGACAGLVLGPRRAISAWRAGGHAHALFNMKDADYAQLLRLTVGELRAQLRVPIQGLATHPPGLHADAPRPGSSTTMPG